MKRAISRTKRAVAFVLVIVVVTACHRGIVEVDLKDVARAADDVRAKGRAEIEAIEWPDEGDKRRTTATIRREQRVNLGGFPNTSFGELLDKCPTGAFGIDAETKRDFPDCKLMASSHEGVEVETRLFVHRGLLKVLTGVAGASLGIGIVYCAKECGSPYQEISIGTAIVGGVIAVLAIVFIAGIDTN